MEKPLGLGDEILQLREENARLRERLIDHGDCPHGFPSNYPDCCFPTPAELQALVLEDALRAIRKIAAANLDTPEMDRILHLCAAAGITGDTPRDPNATMEVHLRAAIEVGARHLKQRDMARDALYALLTKLEELFASKEYQAVWTVAQLHRGPYQGPTLAAEMEAARAALGELRW